MTIGDRIRARRAELEMSQRELSKRLDTDVMNVSRWELGRVTPTVESCRGLASALGVSLDWLINGEDPPAQGSLEATGTEG